MPRPVNAAKFRRALPLLCLLPVACAARPPESSVPASVPAPAATPRPTSTSTATSAPQASLFERLAHEAAQRPAGSGPRADALAAALAARGLGIERWKQVLASPVGARFCMAGQTTAGLGLALCEFDSAQAAERGRAHSRATFDRLIPGRQLLVNRTALLTVTPPQQAPARGDEAGRVIAIFASL